jgi:molybdopterin-guanine dinucleotide biosynthesis protein A
MIVKQKRMSLFSVDYTPKPWQSQPENDGCYHFCMERTGFVLVGGRSTRMGRDKALLPYRGVTLVQHVAVCVEAAAGSVALVGPPEAYGALGYPVIPDVYPGQGPLSGIHAALGSSRAEWSLIVACDMPSVTPEFLRSLLEAAEQEGGDCLLPCSPSGRPEPLCAVYRRSALPVLAEALHRNVRKVTAALEGLRVIGWPVAAAAWFENVNTPREWAMHGRVPHPEACRNRNG